MAIGTAAALIGSAVVGAGASLYGASKASKAASKAADQNAQIQREQYQQTRQDLQPYASAGGVATQALLERLGLSQGGGGPGGGKFEQAQAYMQANPDVAQSQWLASLDAKSIGDHTGDGQVTAEDRALWHHKTYGQAEGRQLPAVEEEARPAVETDRGVVERPTFTRPAFTEEEPTFSAPTFGPAPDVSDYINPADFQASPGYEFRLNEGIRNLNAKYGARGLLKSGAAIQGVNDYAAGSASDEYANWFNQNLQRYGAAAGQFNADRASALGQFNADRAAKLGQYNLNRNIFNANFDTDTDRAQNIFESDRAYDANRYDVATGNLFNLAGMGQSAAAGQANAGQNYAAAATANNNAMASVKGNAAIAGANGINNAINTGIMGYGLYRGGNPFGFASI